MFQLLRYQRPILKLSVAKGMDLGKKKEELPQAQERLLKIVQGTDEQEMV